MQPDVHCLVFFTFLCSVQCQWDQFARDDIYLENPTTDSPSDSGLNFHDRDQTHFLYSHNDGRTRRQAYNNKYPSYGGGGYSWKHYFAIPPVPIYSNSKESVYIREENLKRLKNTLEKDTIFQFLNPKGLRISIPADSINVRILDFRLKLNEEFRGSDGGHYLPNSSKRGGLWIYDVPELQVQQGNKIYYWLKVNFIKEASDIIVNGVLDIERGNPHSGGDQIPFRPKPAPVIPDPSFGGGNTPSYAGNNPSYGGGNSVSLGEGLGGGMRGAFSWNHQFTINATGSSFSQSSSNNWIRQADLLKNNLQNLRFQFSSPTTLMITIPDANINRIEDIRVKINEEFRANDGGHYNPKSYRSEGLYNFDFPHQQAGPEDRIYYVMRVRLGSEGIDATVRGVLTINYVGSAQGSVVAQPTRPTYSRPSPGTVNSPPSLDGALGGGTGTQRTSWNHRFNINTTYSTSFTEDSANRWFDEAQRFKELLEKDTKFQFYYPTGLSITITGDSEDIKILAFNIKLNEEFRTLGPGNYVANVTRTRDGHWSYYYPNLHLNQGDKVFYWMRVTIGKQAFDNTVKGVLEIVEGDPHQGGSYQPQPPPTSPVMRPPSLSPDYSKPYQPNQNPQTNINQSLKPYQPQPRPKPPVTRPPPVSSYNPYQPNRNPPTIPNQSPNPYQPNQNPLTNSNQKPYQPDQSTSTMNPNPYPPYNIPSDRNPSLPNRNCDSALTSVTKGGVKINTCPGDVLMDHKFNNMDGWSHQISIAGKYLEDEFTSFTQDAENSWLQQGRLYIKPTLLEDKANDSFVRRGELFLSGCTLSNLASNYCHRTAQGFTILPPIYSARLNTENSLSFRYGIVEIRAKFPKGDWLVPDLWLESVNPRVDEKVIIAMSTGNTGVSANQMSAGVMSNSNKDVNLNNIKGSSPWYQGFHTFKMEWMPDKVTFSVDNRKIDELSPGSFPILKQEAYISLGVHAGGYRDFPDQLFPNKPWEYDDPKRFVRFWDAKKDWYPSWKNDPFLQVEYIKVTAL
ncbi:uncharacterized protein LOC129002652 [Macrosteles quadrilineatus]|uniref:uncharacterized protein LOC129002652 n=1 Tax=Macrosteles quadrilineatus TaxID=74068 RepID=UPI0023E274AE|nr:uncharacterized protein LOC129002652 [Macrosteles quadrilineatus]